MADRVLARAACARARRGRRRRRPQHRRNGRQPLCRLEPTAEGDAGLPVRPPRHGASERPDRAGRRGWVRPERRAGRSSAPTTSPPSWPCSRRPGASSRSGRPHAGLELLFTPKEEVGLRRRLRLRPHAPRTRGPATCTTRRRRSARSCSARPSSGASRSSFMAVRRMPACTRRRAARRSRPRHGRSRTCAWAVSTRRRPRTSA